MNHDQVGERRHTMFWDASYHTRIFNVTCESASKCGCSSFPSRPAVSFPDRIKCFHLYLLNRKFG